MIEYTKEDFSNAYTELLEILQHIPNSYLIKIPKEKINCYIKNKNYNYKFVYNDELSYEEQNIMELTKILIANLYTDFIADENDLEIIKEKDKHKYYEQEKLKKEKYNVDNIFKKKETNEDIQITSLIVPKKDNIIKRIIYKIKQIFNLT